MLRIIAGQYRGRTIAQPATDKTRPTVDRVKEAMFSMVDSLLMKRGVPWTSVQALDLFAGSGALVLESLSRGASFGMMVEPGQEAARTIEQNMQHLKVGAKGRLLKKSALDLGNFDSSITPEGTPFQLVFLDPPYAFKELDHAVKNLLDGGWLAPGGLVVFELSAQVKTPDFLFLTVLKDKTFGRIKIVIAENR